MSTERRTGFIRGLWNSPRAQIALGVVLLLCLLAWLAPRPYEQIATVGDGEVWRADQAPSVREILWETPEVFAEPEQTGVGTGDTAQFVTPHLTDNGATLYFSRRIDGGQTDIFVMRLVDGQWQSPQPVSNLNSDADDLGLVVSSTGREMYFYSNRAGGFGGSDLYVAQRTQTGWSIPRNAGTTVNSTADEYDPALSPDGRAIYFASNRNESPVPDQRSGRDRLRPWNTTLRAQRDRVTFDLYQARRATTESAWSPAVRMAGISAADSSDGAPFVSSDGAFLYFSSDRPVRRGEARNLDLFRTRLNRPEPTEPVNLGAGVNTAADETEPALSTEGFTLVFASNRDGADRLYATRCREVVRYTQWDTGHIPVLRNVWIFVPIVLLAAILAWLIWHRRTVIDRMWPARFFLGSVVINMLLLFLLAVWRFPEVLSVVTKVFEESVPAPEMLEENAHQSHEDGREAYEKVADLKSLETEVIPETVRQVSEPQSVPEQTERLTQTISAAVARALPPEQVLFIPSRQPQNPMPPPPSASADSPLTRHRRTPTRAVAALSDPVDVELPGESLPDEPAPPTQVPVEVEPAETRPTRPPESAAAAQVPVTVQSRTERLIPENVTLQEPERQPSVPRPGIPVERRPQQRPIAVAASDSKLPDLPATPGEVPSEVPKQSVSTVERAVPNNSPQSRRVTVATKNTLPLPAPVTPTDRSADRQRELQDTSPVERASPLSRQPRQIPGVTAVASGDTSVPEVVTATEIPVERSVEGKRPEFLRSSAATTLRDVTLKRPAPNSELPVSRPTASTPMAAATTQTDVLNNPPVSTSSPLPRRRSQRSVASVLVAELDVQAASAGEESPVPTESAPGSAASEIERKPISPDRAKATGNRLEMAPLPGIGAESLKSVPGRQQQSALAMAEARNPTSPLRRRTSVVRGATDLPVPVSDDVTEVPAENDVAAVQTVESSEASVARSDSGGRLMASVETPRDSSGPVTEIRNRITVGEFSQKTNNAPPAFSPVTSRLNRKRARAMKVALARDNVGLQALFTLRQGDTRRKHIELLGGSEATEKAVSLGLEWLADNQLGDGSWDLRKHQASTKSNSAGTGLGVLPFLAAGYTHNMDGQYREVVKKAVAWLQANQQDSGEIRGKGDSQRMYSHGIAAIALCEAFAMSQDEALKQPAQKALDFIVASQHKASGGWRYNPNERADTSVVGWQMMALKSGEMAGLTVPSSSYELVQKWLASVESQKGSGGTFGYQDRNPRPAMTAEGLLCLQFMGTRRDDPRMRAGADYLLRSLPQKQQKLTSYYWYYATQAMYHMQGDYWDTWNERTKDVLIQTQEQNGSNAGSWSLRDNWEKSGGRIYSTSLKLLMLEVYYRHLPLYDQLEF